MEDKKSKETKMNKNLTEKDLDTLKDILQNVTVTKSGMLRTSSFFVPNPKFDKEFSEGMKALQQIPEQLKQLLKVMTKLLEHVTENKKD